MNYPIIFEGSEDTGFSAYLPDMPGCAAAGDTLPEVRSLIKGAIAMHLKGMREDGEPIPKPSYVEFVEVA